MDTGFILIQRMKQGDEKAFDIFVRKYYGEIFKYCKFHCSDTEYAGDLTQETFLKFFANLNSYNFQGKTKNYLYTIAGNLCKDFYKKKKDLPVQKEELARYQTPLQMDYIIDKVMVEMAVKLLPYKLQEVIILYYFQGLKMPEIASVLDISLSLVKYRLKQARNKLAELIGEEDQENGFNKAKNYREKYESI